MWLMFFKDNYRLRTTFFKWNKIQNLFACFCILLNIGVDFFLKEANSRGREFLRELHFICFKKWLFKVPCKKSRLLLWMWLFAWLDYKVDHLWSSSSMFSTTELVKLVKGSELLLSILLEVAACCISMLSSLDSSGTFTFNILFQNRFKKCTDCRLTLYFVIIRLGIRNT